MYGYVYLTYCEPLNLYYVGQHKAERFEPENYIGSGSFFDWALKKYSRCKFKNTLLEEADSKEQLNILEALWINMYSHKPTANLNTMGEALKGNFYLPKVEIEKFASFPQTEMHTFKTIEEVEMSGLFYTMKNLLDIVNIPEVVKFARKVYEHTDVCAAECIHAMYGTFKSFLNHNCFCLRGNSFEAFYTASDFMETENICNNYLEYPINTDYNKFVNVFGFENNPDTWEKYAQYKS